ncbi:alpha/beta hydrolase [Idiomarina sp. UBA4520]|jgi:pimeloyl-ACP methyl ester carboxylesterase|uniref:alpha/beta hydrolase n=1 Tax=Idiomarina sp. UBA4520 TaxID=1946647 RepID=UPI000AD81A7B|nr:MULTISPECIES: alpha/beta hydrolase [unclassified Idiomarina]MBF38744.1 peptidase [Idiomarinaceae bacterium]|tara:strand:+ start:1251 stop:2711 length:1461 start_codon:yes stop_codon:yes gene_type:complete
MKQWMLVSIPLLVLSAFNSNVQAQQQKTTDTIDNECYLPGIQERLECGIVQVPENYEKPQGKQIGLHYAVLPAIQEGAKSDPMLILAGGPGQAATELAPMISRMFDKVRQKRDILLIDQRGTGKSHPLECDISRPDELIRSDDDQDLAELTEDCLQKYSDTDTTQYHTVNAVKDFERVREHLGVQQLNLYGGSYGTRVGLTYLREAPESVRTATLDAVAPPQVIIGPFGQHGAQAFEAMLKNCEEQAACQEQFPNLEQDYFDVMSALEKQDVLLDTHDPLSFEPITINLTPGRFSSIVRMALYHPNTRQLLPYAIHSASEKNYKAVLGLMGGTMSQSSIYLGLMLSVVCSEDLPRATEQLLAEDGDNQFIGARTGDAFIDMCKGWKSAPVPSYWAEPVVSDKPVLLLSGELDPVTPPSWGELAADTLPNSRHLVAPNASHTIASHTCANTLIAEFIETADVSALDGSCLQQQRLKPFVLNQNGEGL